MSMGPEDIAGYVDRLWDELTKRQQYGAEYKMQVIKVALREKLRYEAKKTGGLRDR